MSTGLIGIIKKAAMDAVDNAKMCDLRYGKVVSVSPLKVQITNQFTIPSSLLTVPQHLTNYTTYIDISDTNGGNKESKRMTVYNALRVGDKVALLRMQGGQSYFILDRI